MAHDPKYDVAEHPTPELEPVVLTAEHQARADAAREVAARSHAEGMAQVLADAEAGARRLAAKSGMSTNPDVYGAHCVACEERWCLPADEATCAHMPICEDCWPNGCAQCEAEVEAGIRRREKAAGRILSAALELRTGADDLSDADLGRLDWLVRKDVMRHVDLTIESLLRVRDVMRSQTAGSKP